MAAELGLILAVAGVLAFTVSVGMFVLHTPRCPRCRRPGVGEAREIADADSFLVELVYRCVVCDGVLGRRTLGHPEG
jgi:hypothetical protein